MRLPFPARLSLLLLAPLTIGCLAEMDEDVDLDRADDLVDRKLIVHPTFPEIVVQVPTTLTVKPEVRETGKVLEVWTDDIRILNPEGNVYVDVDDCTQDDSRYLMQLEYRPTGAVGEQPWTTLKPVENDDAWGWSFLVLTRKANGRKFVHGSGFRYRDLRVGTRSARNSTPTEIVELYIENVEFRIPVYPAWHSQGWDDDGYETTVQITST